MTISLDVSNTLPNDGYAGALVGRVWRPDAGGPSVVAIRADGLFDITSAFPTVRDLCEKPRPAASLRAASGSFLCTLKDALANTRPEGRDPTKPYLLAPIDLQAVKAAGVTFAISMIERIIEERAKGDAKGAEDIRKEVQDIIGSDLQSLKPGSAEADDLKQALIEKGLWSQYLEVGIGPDAEIFTKAQVMSAIGTGMNAGLHPISSWNNPEPEVVLAITSDGRIVGATLGNDVNLRDVEGRSALLLSKAKDNNASCVVGPFLRLFDDTFSMDSVRSMQVTLTVDGIDGFHLEGVSHMDQMSRDPADLVRQLIGVNHQYPDGAVLFLGTLFAPTKDRDAVGQGFTHHSGDTVKIGSRELGGLVCRMMTCGECEPWVFGISHLMRNLAKRGLLI